MEDLGFGDLVDYSLDSLEGIFTTMGELAPAGSTFLGWEMEQQRVSSVPPQVDSGFAHLPDGNISNSLLMDFVGLTTVGGQTLVEIAPETSTSRFRAGEQNRQNPT